MLDAIEDRAEQKGTGRWTVQAALQLGVAVPTIAAAVDARILSAAKELGLEAEAAFETPRRASTEGIAPEVLRDALYAARIATYAQGFALLAAASAEHAYGTSLFEVARIWSAGCIIRARLLDPVRRALAEAPAPPLLLLASDLRDAFVRRLPAWRRVVAASTRAGYAILALTASLNWLEMLTTGRGSVALIQARPAWRRTRRSAWRRSPFRMASHPFEAMKPRRARERRGRPTRRRFNRRRLAFLRTRCSASAVACPLRRRPLQSRDPCDGLVRRSTLAAEQRAHQESVTRRANRAKRSPHSQPFENPARRSPLTM